MGEFDKLEKEVSELKHTLSMLKNEETLPENEGLSLRVGGVLYNLSVSDEQTLDAEDERIKEKIELLDKTIRVSEFKTKETLIKMKNAFNSLKAKVEKEKEKYEKLISSSSTHLPDIGYNEASRGLTVVKGEKTGQLIYLYNTFYFPKTVDGIPLKATFSKKLITPIVICITVSNDKVYGVSVRKYGNLEKFEHYHSLNGYSDCWGSHNFNTMPCKTFEDIITIGKIAAGMLENINSKSPAKRSPFGLPRLSTVVKNADRQSEKPQGKLSKDQLRMGVVNDTGGVFDTTDNLTSNTWSA